MKKILIFGLFMAINSLLYTQTPGLWRATVAVLPFEAGSPVTNNAAGAADIPVDYQLSADANTLSGQLVNELTSWDALNIITDNGKSDYTIAGKLEKVNDQYILSASVTETGTGKVLNTATEQAAAVSALSSQIFSFAAQATENIPFPNYLLGRWTAVINMVDGPLTCILDFKSDRTVTAIQYDTWEHRLGTNALRYQGFGSGTYTYWGYARRTIRGVPVDGFVTINLKLSDVLPKYTTVSYTRINYSFNDDKSVFELAGGGLGCGDNFTGASVYPGQNVAYVKFTKIN